jgi:hypothetical protein
MQINLFSTWNDSGFIIWDIYAGINYAEKFARFTLALFGLGIEIKIRYGKTQTTNL